jgi:hypothetical protein
MANDLPVMLAGPTRARIPYGHNPTMLLYFLDQNAFPPESPGMWVSGGRRTDVSLRTVDSDRSPCRQRRFTDSDGC